MMTSTQTVFSAILTFPISRAVQQLIDQSIHEVISARYINYPHRDFGKCAVYAIVGAQVLSMLTGVACEAVSGGQIMDCGQHQYIVISPSRRELRNAKNLSEISMYHCWIQVNNLHNSELNPLIIDFTLRHDPYCASLLNRPFLRDDNPEFVWEEAVFFDKLIPEIVRTHPHLKNREHGWLWRDNKCEKLLHRYALQNQRQFSLLCADILITFANYIEMHNS